MNPYAMLGIGMAMLTAGVSAAGLVGYFKWRTQVRRRILARAEDYRGPA